MIERSISLVKIKTIVFLLCALLLIPIDKTNAAYDLSLERAVSPTNQSYTLGDIAIAKLAAYGAIDEQYVVPQEENNQAISRCNAVKLIYELFGTEPKNKNIPFTDVNTEYIDAIAWAYQNKLVNGTSKSTFNDRDITKEEFTAILLRYLGNTEFDLNDAPTIIYKMSIAPIGLSNEFTFGDAALYLQAFLEYQSKSQNCSILDLLNIDQVTQIPFPTNILLIPNTPDEVDIQLKEAIQYIPNSITLSSEYIGYENLYEVYQQYRWEQFTIENQSYEVKTWYDIATTVRSSLEPQYDIYGELNYNSPGHIFFDECEHIYKQLNADEITLAECDYLIDMKEASYFGTNQKIKFRPFYNEAWILACDFDEVFTAYKDDTIGKLANDFYETYIVPKLNCSEYEIIMAAKQAIINKAQYDNPISKKDGYAIYSDDSHTAEGFFENGRIVCDGYSCVFQYLMIRAGIPCIEVLGSITSKKDAENNYFDHSWNKVYLDGTWYNIDICWADTGYPTKFDLKSDDFYQQNRHWASYHNAGMYYSPTNYKK